MATTLLGGCSLFGGDLKGRAAAYYNFMVGLSPKTKYSSFLSPAYRHTFTSAHLRRLDKAISPGEKPIQRYSPARTKDIAVAQMGQYAFTTVNPELGRAFESVGPARWVNVGGRWYRYTGSEAEVNAYGKFPVALSPPAPPKPAKPADKTRSE
jgi:hypothetical protein